MKTFYSDDGKEINTLTVAELREVLAKLPDELPVLATWESLKVCLAPSDFSVKPMFKGSILQTCACLVIDVDNYK